MMKKIKFSFAAKKKLWVGDGFYVHPLLRPQEGLYQFTSPFLLMDYSPPFEFSKTSKRRGVVVLRSKIEAEAPCILESPARLNKKEAAGASPPGATRSGWPRKSCPRVSAPPRTSFRNSWPRRWYVPRGKIWLTFINNLFSVFCLYTIHYRRW